MWRNGKIINLYKNHIEVGNELNVNQLKKIFYHCCNFCQSWFGFLCVFVGCHWYGPMNTLFAWQMFYIFHSFHVSLYVFEGCCYSCACDHIRDSDDIILGASHHVFSQGTFILVPLITDRTVIISFVTCFLMCLSKVQLFMYTLSQWGHYYICRIWTLGQNSNTTARKYKCPNCEWRHNIGQAFRKHRRNHTRLKKILMSTVWSKVHEK